MTTADDQANAAAEPVADSHSAATDQDSDTTNANTEPAGNQPADASGNDKGLEVYGDSAYGTGEARAAYRRGGHDTVIKPKPLRPAVEGGFTLDDFDINEQAGTVTCPAGHTRPMSPKRTVTFGKLCARCPLRALCTTATDGRSMTIHPHEDLLRAARAQAHTPEFTQAYPTSSTIERIIAWTATQHGRRVKLRYLGTSKNNTWLHTRCAALNLRTLIKRGLTRQTGRGPWPDRPQSTSRAPANTQTTKPTGIDRNQEPPPRRPQRPDLMPYSHTDDPVGVLPTPAKALIQRRPRLLIGTG